MKYLHKPFAAAFMTLSLAFNYLAILTAFGQSRHRAIWWSIRQNWDWRCW